MTQRQYVNAIARAAGEPDITASVPYAFASKFAFTLERMGHLFRLRKPPLVTRYAVWLMGRRCFFECAKVKDQLGWSSAISYEQGIPGAVRDAIGTPLAGAGRAPPNETLSRSANTDSGRV